MVYLGYVLSLLLTFCGLMVTAYVGMLTGFSTGFIFFGAVSSMWGLASYTLAKNVRD